MTYQVSRKPRLVTGTILGLMVAFLLMRPHVGRVKESYFDRVFSHCAEANGLTEIEWTENYGGHIYFDASARHFVPKDQHGDATVTCVTRWAGLLIEDDKRDEGTNGKRGLRVIVSGEIFSPPEYRVDIQRFSAERASTP